MIRWLLICLAFLLPGCTKEVEISLVGTKALVLNSLFNPDSLFTFRISETASLPDNYDTLKGNLHISLYEKDNLIFESVSQSDIFRLNLKPVPQGIYSVEVNTENLPALKATDTIPALVQIDNAYMIFPAGVDPFGFYKAEACISFTDPQDAKNFYELVISSKPGGINGWYTDYETNDPALMNEGDQDYHPDTFFFSDDLFNGKSYTLKIKHGISYSQSGSTFKVFSLYATLRSVSRTYYKYRKYFTRHSYNQQFQNEFLDLIFKGEPQNMYTNLENGYGIFAGYCETTRQIIHNE